MKTKEFLDKLRRQGIIVFVENGSVQVNAEKQFLTDDFLQNLKTRKAEIYGYLTELEKLNQTDFIETLNFFNSRGCEFEFTDDGKTFNYKTDVLTEAEIEFLTKYTNEIHAIFLQNWLMKNVIRQNNDLLERFKAETLKQISETGNYLDGVILTSWEWWSENQGN
jgi:organic radical activating enzyme